MDSVAVVIIQKANVLISSYRFNREVSLKIRVNQLVRYTNRNKNNIRSHWRCDQIDTTG